MTKYLKKNHSEYRELQVKATRIVDENPALRILINNMEGIVLTPEDHKALHKLKNAHRLFPSHSVPKEERQQESSRCFFSLAVNARGRFLCQIAD